MYCALLGVQKAHGNENSGDEHLLARNAVYGYQLFQYKRGCKPAKGDFLPLSYEV
jgi:hypothetical protein